jgi:flagellar hook-associated protein 3 FlgL
MMRISTQSFYETNLSGMNDSAAKLLRVQRQVSSGTKNLVPSDDPIAATRALAVSQSIAVGSQYVGSRAQARNMLSLTENALQSVTSMLQDTKELVVYAGNGTLSDVDRESLATTLQSRFDQLLGLANADDGNGQYLFAGFKSSSIPFIKQSDGSVLYAGDEGRRLMQVDVSRQISATDTGRSIFQTVRGGTPYVTAADSANTGTGAFGPVSTVDANDANYGHDFTINFSVAAGVTTYSVVDNSTVPVTTIVPLLTPYTPGQTLGFGGVQIKLDGAPNNGDSFDVATTQNAGTDMFQALSDIIAALKQPLDTGTPADRAQFLNALSTGNRKISNAHDNVLTVRSSVGSRMQELDSLDTTGQSRKLFDKAYLSGLQDLDYASAISEFYQRQTALQATQETFVKLQNTSLIQYLR